MLKFDNSTFGGRDIDDTWITEDTLKNLNAMRDDMESRLRQSRAVNECNDNKVALQTVPERLNTLSGLSMAKSNPFT